jgi:hypothetical protein
LNLIGPTIAVVVTAIVGAVVDRLFFRAPSETVGSSGSTGAARSPTWSPGGRTALVTHKLSFEDPEQYQDAAIAGIRHLLDREGEPTLLVTTQGFRDALRIAYQNRPHCPARAGKQRSR